MRDNFHLNWSAASNRSLVHFHNRMFCIAPEMNESQWAHLQRIEVKLSYRILAGCLCWEMNDYLTAIFFDNLRLSRHAVGETNEFNGCETGANSTVRFDAGRTRFILKKRCTNCFVFQLQIIVGDAQWCRLAIGCSTCAHIFQAWLFRWFADTENVRVIFASDFILFARMLAHIVPDG